MERQMQCSKLHNNFIYYNWGIICNVLKKHILSEWGQAYVWFGPNLVKSGTKSTFFWLRSREVAPMQLQLSGKILTYTSRLIADISTKHSETLHGQLAQGPQNMEA